MTSDEWYTPRSAVVPIIEHLKPNSRVLCPFDTENSNFVKELTERGFLVDQSHISEGIDFFSLPKPDVDYVVSNPPFSRFDEILNRLYEWGIPFAMIWNTQRLFDSQFRMRIAEIGGGGDLVLISSHNIYQRGREEECKAELPELLLVQRNSSETDHVCGSRRRTM